MSKFGIVLLVTLTMVLAAESVVLWRIDGDLRALRDQVAQAGVGSSYHASGVPPEAAQRVDAVDHAIKGIEKNLEAVSAKVDEQNMLVNRALGNLLPYELPSETAAAIRSIQDRIEEAVQSPSDPARLETIRGDLAAVIEPLPPWAQEELLPRLVPIRWNLEALWLVENPGADQLDAVSAYSASCETLLANRPLGSHDLIADRLEQSRQDAESRIKEIEERKAIDYARSMLGVKRPSSTAELATAVRGLSVYSSPQVQQLKSDLNRRIFLRSVSDALDDLRKDVETYTAMGSGPIKEYAIERTRATTMDLHLRLMSSMVADKDLYEKLRLLEKHLGRMSSELRNSRSTDYQIWALNNIKRVSTYQVLLDAEIAKIEGAIDRGNPASDARKTAEASAKAKLRKVMVFELAPIDEGALDVAVGQWFRKVYQERFEHLDEAEQLKLVDGFASTPKKSPDALL